MGYRVNLLASFFAVVLLNGCVTESNRGGLPKPAPVQDRVRAQLDLARGYLASGEVAAARRPIDRALSLNPKSVEAHVLQAVLYEAEDEQVLAEQSYRTALKIDGRDPQLLNNYGVFLYRRGRAEESAELLRRLVTNTKYRARAQAFEHLGLAELSLERREEARNAFTRALMLNQRQRRSTLELADLAFSDGDVPQAKNFYQSYRRLAGEPSARSLCLGLKIASAFKDQDAVASLGLTLKNLYPKSREARECLTS